MSQASGRATGARRRDDPMSGALWMLVSCCLLAVLAGVGRYLALQGVHPFQIVFLRIFFAFLTLLPLLAWRGPSFVRTRHIKLYGVRVCIGLIAMTTWFSALAHLPIGDVTAISFLAPLVATAGAALILRETVRLRRWTATIVGFLGRLVVLQPGSVPLGTGTWLALASAAAMGFSVLIIKTLAGAEDPDKVVFISNALMTPLALIPALFVWSWPEPWLWPALLCLGPLATLGHVTLTRAFAAADASFVVTFEFARLPVAVFVGYLMFGEVTGAWTWIGAAIIFSSAVYIVHRERRLKVPVTTPEARKSTPSI